MLVLSGLLAGPGATIELTGFNPGILFFTLAAVTAIKIMCHGSLTCFAIRLPGSENIKIFLLVPVKKFCSLKLISVICIGIGLKIKLDNLLIA